MKKHDLRVSFALAFALECYFALLFVFAPSKFVVFLHVIPYLLLGLITTGGFSMEGWLFELLAFLIQVLVLAAVVGGFLHVRRKSDARRRRLITATMCLVLLALAIGALTPRVSRSSIQLFADMDCACGDYEKEVSGIIVLNPLRNRTPEVAADNFFSDMKSGKCSANIAQELCDGRERIRPAVQWKLKNRNDAGDTVSLFYVVKGGYREGDLRPPDNTWGEAMVQVERTGSQWKVTSYGAYY